jgi:hypothetical protein
LQLQDIARAPAGTYETFEPLLAATAPINIFAAHSEIDFYTWGNSECCIAAGATSATLIDSWILPANGSTSESGAVAETNTSTPIGNEPPGSQRALNLKVADVLIFEEVVGPVTGNTSDADRSHRQAVRLTKVRRAIDPLYHQNGQSYGQPIVQIEWCSEDALTFPLCISAKMPAPDCSVHNNISVARGNVILVDNSSPVSEPLGCVPTLQSSQTCATECEPGESVIEPGKFCPILKSAPLTFSEPLPPCGCTNEFIAQDPRQAVPRINLTGTLTQPDGSSAETTWTPKPDLLESEPNDLNFVVEVDDDGFGHLRFGNGDEGRMPDAGTTFTADYMIGNGKTGNVGADTIVHLVLRQPAALPGNPEPRNPLPASGGIDPEPVAEVKMFAPYAFADVLERAITGDDYAMLAADNGRRLEDRPSLFALPPADQPSIAAPELEGIDPRAALEEEPGESSLLPPDICTTPFTRLQNAKGSLRWNGSWYEALVALDPLGSEASPPELLAEITAYLEPYRRIGHDLAVAGADYVGIDLAVSICVMANYERAHVEAALLDVFSDRVLPDGSLGFFNPDNLTFGEGVYVSRIIAAAQAVAGVMEVTLNRLERYEIGNPAAVTRASRNEIPSGGVLALGAFEIARLDNDPNHPENGRLTLSLRGGS